MKKWLVISPSPQTLLPRWTYCGHFEALGRTFQGLVFLGYFPLHFQCHSSWLDTPAKKPGQWLVSGEGLEWRVGKSTPF